METGKKAINFFLQDLHLNSSVKGGLDGVKTRCVTFQKEEKRCCILFAKVLKTAKLKEMI